MKMKWEEGLRLRAHLFLGLAGVHSPLLEGLSGGSIYS